MTSAKAGPILSASQGAARFAVAWLIGGLIAYAIGSVSQSVFVLNELSGMGATLKPTIWLKVILHDLRRLMFGGKYVWYGANLLVAFVIALPCAIFAARLLKLPLLLVATVAGAVGLVTMISIVHANAPARIFFGTGGWEGMLPQIAAGAIGGAVFALLFQRGVGRAQV